MSFASFLARTQGDYAVFVTARISGIPYVFSNLRSLPSSWTLPTGTAWSGTLVWANAKEATHVVAQRPDWESGVTASGTLRLEFGSDPLDSTDVWQDLLAPTTRNEWFASPREVIPPKPSAQWMTLLDTTGISPGDVVHRGSEALLVGSVSATQIYVTRGYLDSVPQWYGPRGPVPLGQQRLTGYPEVWRGRLVEVWLHAATRGRDGGLVPLGADLSASGYATSPEAQQIFRGPVYDTGFDADVASAWIVAQSLEQLFERPAISRGRKYQLGPHLTSEYGWCWIESGGVSTVEVSFDTTELTFDLSETELPNQPVPASYLGETIALLLSSSGGIYFGATDKALIKFELVSGDDGLWYAQFAGAYYSASTGNLPAIVHFHVHTALDSAGSAFRALGWTEDFWLDPDNGVRANSWGLESVVRCPNPIPAYYVAPGTQHVLYRGTLAPDTVNARLTGDPPDIQGTTTVRGDVDGVAFRVGEHALLLCDCRWATSVYDTSGGGDLDYRAFLPTMRASHYAGGQLVPGVGVEIVVPQRPENDTDFEMSAGLYFARHHLLDVIRWIACSHGVQPNDVDDAEWRVFAEGFGCAIPTELIDHQAFDEVRDARPDMIARGWWIGEGESLRDLAARVATAYGLAFYPAVNASGRMVISVREVLAPATTAEPVVTIDSGWQNNVTHPVEVTLAERDVVNRVDAEYNYDPLARKYLSTDNTAVDVDSVALYGPATAVRVEYPWLRTATAAQFALRQSAEAVFRLRGKAQTRARVECMHPYVWALRAGDVVAFTHQYALNYQQGGRGFSAVLAELTGKADKFGAQMDSFGEVELLFRTRRRVDAYCPSLRLVERVGSTAEYTVCATADDGGFSAVGGDTDDIDAFVDAVTDAWSVTVALEYDASTIVTRTITAVSATSVTFDSALTAGLHADLEACVVSFSPAATVSAANASQQDYAYLCDATSLRVTLASGTRAATEWY